MKKTAATVITSFTSFAFVLGISAIAFADTAPSAGAADKNTPRPIVPPPPFSALPAGTMTTPPKDKAPTRIPKIEKVEGFYVADPPKNTNPNVQQAKEPPKITNVMIFGKEEEAKAYSAGKGFGFGVNDETMCFAQPPRAGSRPMRSGPLGAASEPEVPAEWPSDIEPSARISAPMKPPPPRKKGEKPPAKPKPSTTTYGDMEVTAVHQERFVVQEDKKAHIEVVDAWVDPVTHGVRLIGKSTLPLERIGSAWHGVKLYAARGEKVIHVVARRDKLKEAATNEQDPAAISKAANFRMINANRQPLMIETPSGEHDQTQCGFAHVMLKAQQGAAETAMFETSTVFIDPPEPKPEKVVSEGKDDDNEGFAFNGRDANQPVIRLRPFRATVSSTWSSKDTAPVISVSFGWAGREREM